MRGLGPLVVLLLLALNGETMATMLGSVKCTWGPMYWCENIRQSKECEATKHCIQRFWTEMDLPEDNDDVCTICKNMVQEARDTLRSNETISELKEVFETSCGYIPVKIIADECKVLSVEFVEQLVETLSSEMNPQLVCATAGLCNSARIDALLEEYYRANPRTECDICKYESNKLAFKIGQIADNDIKDKLLELCGYLGSYSDACKATVIDDFDIIHSMLKDLGQGKLCDLVGICSETNQHLVAQYSSSTNDHDIQCEFCEKVIKHWVDTWTANTTEAEFKQVLEAICHKLDKPNRVSRCLHIVDDYYIPWFNFLLHEVDPHEICTLVGLCGNKKFMQVDDSTPITLLLNTDGPNDQDEPIKMMPLQPAIRMTGQEEFLINHPQSEIDISNGLIGGYYVPKTVVAVEKPGCVICEYVINKLEETLENNKTQEAIEIAVETICYSLPGPVQDQCNNLIETYEPALVQMLLHDIQSSQICSRLQLCEDDILVQQVSHPVALQLLKKSDDSCALCEFAMTEVFSFLNDTSDEQEIENVLDSICYALPHSISNECQKLVAEYSKTLMKLIVDNFSPDEICAQIKMCKAKVSFKGDEKCVLCEYAVTTLDKIIADKHNEQEVKEALEKLCSYLPKTINDKCTQFVEQYSDMIIDLITHDLTPDQICQQLGLCKQVDEIEHLTVNNEKPYCTLCEYAIGEVDKVITDKQNEQEIKNALDRICYELSAPIQKECVNMVNKYMDKIIELFVSEYTPQEICAELGLCKQQRMMGSSFMSNEISKNVNQPNRLVVLKGMKGQGPLCVICEFAMSVLEDKMLNNRTFDMVERAVQMVCSYLPETVAKPCEQFVDEYGDKIIKIIVDNELEPKEVCTNLTLCAVPTPPRQNKKPVGGCVWGPAYWCKTPYHARVCGTTHHCRKYVWIN